VRKEYELTDDELEVLMNAGKPVVMMKIGTWPTSPQENANRAWQSLGQKRGFDHMTVRPTDKGDKFFTAEEKS
jgi:hypothetical protein